MPWTYIVERRMICKLVAKAPGKYAKGDKIGLGKYLHLKSHLNKKSQLKRLKRLPKKVRQRTKKIGIIFF